jgi:phosphopantetheinyl transferase
MQAVESQNLILYHTELSGQWPEEGARALAARLPYLKRLAVGSGGDAARASLAGIALALRALGALLGRRVEAGEIVFASGEKPRMVKAAAAPDFSISHTGSKVACAAISGAEVGLDIEVGTGARFTQWVVREALLKVTGAGLRAAHEVRDIELPSSELPEASLSWRGERWYVRRLDFFPGTSGCVLTSCPVHVEPRGIPLAELFAT